ncbi:hypothetical protein [Psychrobacillus sp. FSL K6-1464]|uniref:hypothetical protein n=1 Tax=Psychrobacillus sp. FSL K6-1464 TaxID=2921545 RepID=UPI0030FB8A8C
MFKKLIYIPILFFCCLLLTPSETLGATLVKGNFDHVTFDTVLSDGSYQKSLKSITITNKKSSKINLKIDKYTRLSVNTLPTSIDAFKLGMEIEADVNLGKVVELRGSSTVSQQNTDAIGKSFSGTVNRIDKKGTFLSIRLDNGVNKTYYINGSTAFYKNAKISDLSVLYEGDRIKLKIDEYNSQIITSVEINTQGEVIESLYKGIIQKIDPIQNKLIVTDEKVFRDWKWQSQSFIDNTSKSFTNKTSIYVGNKEIKRDQLRYYTYDEVYYVTVKQFGKEVIQKMVIKQSNERTFYEPLTSINTSIKKIGLRNVGLLSYHNGTILIRNGRLVDSYSLQSSGTAFVVSDGRTSSDYANVIHITNDGFQSPNLASHAIYFGKINTTGSYGLTINNAKILSNNYWKDVSTTRLTFSDDSNVVEDYKRSVLKVVSRNEMDERIGQYAYFYVRNNDIIASHIVGSSHPISNLVSVGRFENTISRTNIRVKNVSQWQKGVWNEAGQINSMNIEQTTFIKEGKVISIDDLTPNDRLFIIHESIIKGRLILVD